MVVGDGFLFIFFHAKIGFITRKGCYWIKVMHALLFPLHYFQGKKKERELTDFYQNGISFCVLYFN
jgi:hypothetical protein